MFTTLCTAIVCFWLGQAAPATEKEKAPTVFTNPVAIESGQIRGEVLGQAKDVHAFKGIPYAAPPVGELRWKSPQPTSKWDGVRDCVKFGNACPQKVPALMAAIPQMRINAPYNEDCLYLNIWTPSLERSAVTTVASTGDVPKKPSLCALEKAAIELRAATLISSRLNVMASMEPPTTPPDT